jgi:hypothetical protein
MLHAKNLVRQPGPALKTIGHAKWSINLDRELIARNPCTLAIADKPQRSPHVGWPIDQTNREREMNCENLVALLVVLFEYNDGRLSDGAIRIEGSMFHSMGH